MVEYKPYETDDTTTHYFLIKNDFVWVSIDNCRLIDLHNGEDYEDFTYSIDLDKETIISVNYFRNKDTETDYCYLNSYQLNDEIVDVYQESIISKKLLLKNEAIFEDITTEYNRDKKIENLLDN
jgi:hypothetical protein